MNVKNPALPPSLASDVSRIDAHVVNAAEYDDLPELDETMLACATVNWGGRPFLPDVAPKLD